ncbi:flavodoxin family protein [Exiguobacterium sp. MMG028]|uniref:flavodoxin family protein n=1 Tax=Exiguobacterium sp. MMG028 TaxID=3021979 RepID=UPI0022FE84EF|nr:flavodoxin family protein [Exiguobacterium sp. MMG028]MDA5560824.1 flavodoxin family protein [Exiguobacterium sp. MMG028]
MKALFLNCTLKGGDTTSHTEGLIRDILPHFDALGVESEIVRIVDYNVAFGVTEDEGDGDEWPQIFEKVKGADIIVIGTPLWLGEKSSVATQVVERLYGGSGLTNKSGQAIYYNKVGGVVVTGNEDGAKHACAGILYALSHIGFTVPPNVDTYWVGEAGPGDSYIDAGRDNAFTKSHGKTMAYNLVHFARMLKAHPIPAEGNTME